MKRLIDIDRFLRTLNSAAHVSGLETMSKVAKTMAFMIETQWSLFPEEIREPKWIPVTERLPEEYEYVLLCDREPEPDEEAGYSRMAVGWLEDGQIHCWDDRAARKEFVAWMPLPEPYKEGEQE